MAVPIAFVCVILIWTTTPLAVKWSAMDTGFIFAAGARMTIGTLVCLILLPVFRLKLQWHAEAIRTYLAAGLAIFGAMALVYWSALYIPSGLISVLFGLTPIMTGILAAVFLGEQSLTRHKVLGMLLGCGGLIVIFGSRGVFAGNSLQGILLCLLSVLVHSTSAVLIKRIGSTLPALVVTTGGLLVALPMYALLWLLNGAPVPEVISFKAGVAIIYLGVVGSVFGFILYFYVLKHVEASRAALITLMTPVLALILGQSLNGEVISTQIWMGTGLILLGLVMYQWGKSLLRHLLVLSIRRVDD